MTLSSRGQRGFTLIELLVVIAIIGILSSVVLAAMGTARNRGSDSAVRQNMSSVRNQAEIFYTGQNPNTYTGVCTDTTVAGQLTAAGSAGGGTATCNTSATAWAASSPLRSGGHYCVDSTGAARQISAALTSGTTACPAS